MNQQFPMFLAFRSRLHTDFNILAERVRQRMVLSGQIPENQLSDEEKEFLANQPEPPPDPVVTALEREADNEDDKVTLAGITEERKDRELQAKIENERRDDDRASMKEAFENIKTMAQALKDQALAFKALADAKGIEGIELPNVDAIIASQATVVRESQAEQP